MKKVFIICTVRNATEYYRNKLEDYVVGLESSGEYSVHLPHRDTDQDNTSMGICTENMEAMTDADEVHIFYNKDSQGTHFDMGIAFCLDKPLVIVENGEVIVGKSYPRLLEEWCSRSNC